METLSQKHKTACEPPDQGHSHEESQNVDCANRLCSVCKNVKGKLANDSDQKHGLPSVEVTKDWQDEAGQGCPEKPKCADITNISLWSAIQIELLHPVVYVENALLVNRVADQIRVFTIADNCSVAGDISCLF